MGLCPSSERWSAYLDGEVAGEERARMRGHLEGCENCARLAGELRAVSAAVRGMQVANPSPALMARLERQVDRFAWRGPQRLAGALAGLAACLAVVFGLQMANTSQATAAPENWERAAVRMTADDSGATNSDASVAEWMVAGLGNSGESER